jgi:2-C-methyl-D-erythritol 2,4-cyclodiphosphate synthase
VANLAADLDMDAAAINIKGKTTEKLGFTGRGEGIAAQVVALIARAGQG